MEISRLMNESTYSIRQAIGISNLKKAMNQDARSVAAIIESMSQSSAKIMEHSVAPNKGSHIDVRV